jgi:hypothetical protein
MVVLLLSVLAGLLIVGVVVERAGDVADRTGAERDRALSHRRLMRELSRHG